MHCVLRHVLRYGILPGALCLASSLTACPARGPAAAQRSPGQMRFTGYNQAPPPLAMWVFPSILSLETKLRGTPLSTGHSAREGNP